MIVPREISDALTALAIALVCDIPDSATEQIQDAYLDLHRWATEQGYEGIDSLTEVL